MRQDEFKMICTSFFDRHYHVILCTLTAPYGHVKETSQTTCGFSYHHHLLFGCLHLFMYTIQEKWKILCFTHFSVQHWTCDLVFLHSSVYLYHYCTADSRDVLENLAFFCDTYHAEALPMNTLCATNVCFPDTLTSSIWERAHKWSRIVLKWCNMWSSHLALQSWYFLMLSMAVKDVFCIWEDGRCTKQSHECRLLVCSILHTTI